MAKKATKKFPAPMETYQAAENAVWNMVKKAQLDKAICVTEKKLSKLSETDYHVVLGRSWQGQGEVAARWLQTLAKTADQKFPVSAIYCEMNRFEINTDEWYIDGFAYDRIGDPDDLGWLSSWQESASSRFVLDGMDDLKAVFQRDYMDTEVPDSAINAPSELAILLLTLRMQELVNVAAHFAWKQDWLREEIPVLSAAHETGMICISKTDAGTKQLREARRIARKTPPPTEVRVDGATGPGVYRLSGGWENGNSLPWHVLNHEGHYRDLDPIAGTKLLGVGWQCPRASLLKRKWLGDFIRMYPVWTVNRRARDVIEKLTGSEVEFIPVECDPPMERWIVHPLVQIPLSDEAETNWPKESGMNFTVIRRFAFTPSILAGHHLFRISQHPDSPAGRAGLPFSDWYVSEDLVIAIEQAGVNGVVFEKLFDPNRGSTA
jgi:hypothetical protein